MEKEKDPERVRKIERGKIDLPLPHIGKVNPFNKKKRQVTVWRGFDMSYKSIYLNMFKKKEKRLQECLCYESIIDALKPQIP